MLIFKFGGASVKDAISIKNLFNILDYYVDNELIVVISAMGKTTALLEKILNKYFSNNNFIDDLEALKEYHYNIISNLLKDKTINIYTEFNTLINNLEKRLKKPPSNNYDYEYDQIVSFGELFSTKIISDFFNNNGKNNKFLDIRKYLKTNSIYKEAMVDWDLSENLLKKEVNFNKTKIYITQGFIASNKKNETTTLGREGSDFTAAILAYIFEPKKLTIWKDVEGVYNSDPNIYKNVIKLNSISFNEAVELAYYGAKIIHQKTIKPLQNKNIDLEVKSFKKPTKQGTIISNTTTNKIGVSPEVPIFITKNNQILISIAPHDFSFIAENNISNIFSLLAKYRIKTNLMQNSAVSFSVCVDYNENKIENFISELNTNFKVRYNSKLTLITIRHYNKQIIKQMTDNKKILVQQKSRHTVRYVVE